MAVLYWEAFEDPCQDRMGSQKHAGKTRGSDQQFKQGNETWTRKKCYKFNQFSLIY